MVQVILSLILSVSLAGCAIPAPKTVEINYGFCKAGISGDFRIANEIQEDGTKNPILLVFPVGGPYDMDHIICAISGDHAILDLGKGKLL